MKNGKIIEKGTHEQLMQGDGYYAGLIRIQLAQEKIKTKSLNRKLTRRCTTKRIINDENIQFERRDNAIALSEQNIPLRPCAIITELNKYSYVIIFACLGAVIYGITIPFIGLYMAKTIIALNSRYETIRYDDGLKYSFIFLALAFLLGFGNFVMIWNFMSLGLTLARIYRKKLPLKIQ